MDMFKRIAVLVIVAVMSTGFTYSVQGKTQTHEEKFMQAFGQFIEHINSDILANDTQVIEQKAQPEITAKSSKSKKQAKAKTEVKNSKMELTEKPVNTNADMNPHISSLKKVKKYLNMLKLGRSLEIETGYDKMDDIFPNKYISLKLGNVEDFRSLHPNAFNGCKDEDYILYIKEEYGKEEERTVVSQRAIVFSYVENDHYEVTSTPTLYVKK